MALRSRDRGYLPGCSCGICHSCRWCRKDLYGIPGQGERSSTTSKTTNTGRPCGRETLPASHRSISIRRKSGSGRFLTHTPDSSLVYPEIGF